jgi:hypothetical protein
MQTTRTIFGATLLFALSALSAFSAFSALSAPPDIASGAVESREARPGDRDWDHVERETLRTTLKFTETADRRVIVDNLNGGILVTGYDGDVVELVAFKRIRAESERRLERARKEVVLDMREEGERIMIYVDTPWRDGDGYGHHRGWDNDGYDVRYDLELRVPTGTNFTLKTVNDGDIRVRSMRGKFKVENVNGEIHMSDIVGAGKVSTVNGDITVGFAATPKEELSMQTVNGEIEATFPEAPAADLRFKTMNGEVYTDFEVKSMKSTVEVKEKRGGMKVYSGGDSFMVQSAGGGPEMSFKTLNGDIYLKEK